MDSGVGELVWSTDWLPEVPVVTKGVERKRFVAPYDSAETDAQLCFAWASRWRM